MCCLTTNIAIECSLLLKYILAVAAASLVGVATLNYNTRCGSDTRARWIAVNLYIRVMTIFFGSDVFIHGIPAIVDKTHSAN